jgi:thioredoxin reductase
MNCGAKILLNTKATPEIVAQENPEAVIVCTGAVPARPNIPGLECPNVLHVLDVDSGKVRPRGKVIVCGGGLSGCESALQLAMDGCDVTIVDRIDESEFASGVHPITRSMLLYLLDVYKIKRLGGHIVSSIDEHGVRVVGIDRKADTFGSDHAVPDHLESDYVVDAFGMKPDRETADSFISLMPEVYITGDAYEARNIKHANLRAYDLCCNI